MTTQSMDLFQTSLGSAFFVSPAMIWRAPPEIIAHSPGDFGQSYLELWL